MNALSLRFEPECAIMCKCVRMFVCVRVCMCTLHVDAIWCEFYSIIYHKTDGRVWLRGTIDVFMRLFTKVERHFIVCPNELSIVLKESLQACILFWADDVRRLIWIPRTFHRLFFMTNFSLWNRFFFQWMASFSVDVPLRIFFSHCMDRIHMATMWQPIYVYICICIATATSFILFLLRIQIRQTTKTCNDNKITRSFGVKDECEKWIEPLQSERHRNVRTHNLFPILTHTISLSFRCLLWRNTLFVCT